VKSGKSAPESQRCAPVSLLQPRPTAKKAGTQALHSLRVGESNRREGSGPMLTRYRDPTQIFFEKLPRSVKLTNTASQKHCETGTPFIVVFQFSDENPIWVGPRVWRAREDQGRRLQDAQLDTL